VFHGANAASFNDGFADLPRPERLKLFHVPGAGYDALDLNALPAGADSA